MSEGADKKSADKRRIVIRPLTYAGLEQIAEYNDSDPTAEANRAIREYLERHNFWPPKQVGDAKSDQTT